MELAMVASCSEKQGHHERQCESKFLNRQGSEPGGSSSFLS